MKITLDNYEAFFLDYIEGKLNSEGLSELSLFLSLHPALKFEFSFPENIILQSDKHIYQNKNLIKKFEFEEASINETNFDDFCIAYYEHILSEEKTNELLNFCSLEPRRQKTLNEYQLVFLLPQHKFKFLNKKSVYKKQSFTIQITRIASIAAGIALLITVYLNYKPKKDTVSHSPVIASSKTIKQSSNKVIPLVVVNNKLNKNKLFINNSKKLNLINEINKNIIKMNAITSKPELLSNIPLPALKLLKTYDQEPNLIPSKSIEMQSENKDLATSNSSVKNIESNSLNINELKRRKKKFSLLKIAQVGIWGINTLTDSNISLTEKTDSTGNITALSFESDLLEYHRNKRN